jgi:hypothetical protein
MEVRLKEWFSNLIYAIIYLNDKLRNLMEETF